MKKVAGFLIMMTGLSACGVRPESASALLDTQAFNEPGMIPEYAPSKAVLFDESIFLDNLEESTQLVSAVRSTGVEIWFTGSKVDNIQKNLASLQIPADKFQFFKTGNTQNPWIRDYGPISYNTANGRSFLDFGYDEESSSTANAVPIKIGGELNVNVIDPNINLDGGNITCDHKVCFVSHYSQDPDEDSDAAAHLSDDQITALGKAVGRKVHAVGKLPYEVTGHIDLWAKIVAPGKILVAELTTDQLAKIYPAGAPGWIKKVKKFYDTQADSFVNMGFQVIRLPSPVPDYAFGARRFRSYLNSLQIGSDYLIVPRYLKDRQDDPDTKAYVDEQLLPEYEKDVEEKLGQHGLKVIWTPADYAILGDGAVHCQTMQVAK